ncbi:glycosyltransferase family 4 protein [Algiphilus sp.]|uniref:glycosyltransferase family 4 protein n=1 Tax=Algiphilus sp. TaxID=1872431 RepID=UPI003B529BEA
MPWQLLYLGLRYRVTHAFAFSINYGAMLLPLRLILRLPYTLFLRADTRRNNQINGVPSLVLRLERVLESAALWHGRAVAVSETLLGQVLARNQCVRPRFALVMPNEPPPQSVEGAPYSGGAMVLAVVGVLESRKRVDLAVEAVRLLRDADLRLRIFGAGPSEEALRCKAADLVASGQVEFAGWCPPEAIWSSVHLLLHPSEHEGHSNAMLEALSAGLPLLASDLPEHREWLPDEFLVKGSEAFAWAEAISRIAHSQERYQRLALQAQSLVQRLAFDWEARACEEILDSREYQKGEVMDG